ncbi:MAG TPA: phosphoglucosamine mutase [Candidatus Methylacidiphilales bacterium]|jgi:phosphoglucosamine mutase|nr:phosphoglucosamine mutase [Candidatus Methylacidiphilales bacterium]
MGTQSRLFGTDGIRGCANAEPLTPELALAFGRAVAAKFGQRGKRILIGRDTRISGPMIESAVAAGIAAMGIDVGLLGILPTPAIAYLTRQMGESAGIVISASHNPYEDNGLKIFNAKGLKCDDALELELEKLILGDELRGKGVTGGKIGRVEALVHPVARYTGLMLGRYTLGEPGRVDLRGVKIVVDAGNGAAFETTPRVLRGLGAEVIPLNVQPNGVNINAGCGSTHPEATQKAVRETGAQIGLAHDGDADRLICCDERGELLDGDEMLAVLGLSLLKRGKLAKNTLVATVMSNLGLDEAFAAAGGKVLRAGVGDRYVLEVMLKEDLNLGGEQSGHVILKDINSTGDGLATALELLRIMTETGEPLSKLRLGMRKYPQLLVNLKVREKIPLEQLPEVTDAVKQVEKELGEKGRVLLRYSGTEPKIRLLVETREESQLQPTSDRILGPIKKALVD